jgi:hypothetical protein
MLRYSLILSVVLVQYASGADANRLTPVLAKPGKVHLEMDFEDDFVVKKGDEFFALGQDSLKDVILKYSFKIVGGKKTKLLPMIEAGHHLRRIYFGPDGSQILVDHEKTIIAEDDFVLQTDKWYHVMLEIKGDESLVRFQDGPTLYGTHPGVGAEFANYNIGITATNKGTIYIDNITIWHASEVQRGWKDTKKKLVERAKS